MRLSAALALGIGVLAWAGRSADLTHQPLAGSGTPSPLPIGAVLALTLRAISRGAHPGPPHPAPGHRPLPGRAVELLGNPPLRAAYLGTA